VTCGALWPWRRQPCLAAEISQKVRADHVLLGLPGIVVVAESFPLDEELPRAVVRLAFFQDLLDLVRLLFFVFLR